MHRQFQAPSLEPEPELAHANRHPPPSAATSASLYYQARGQQQHIQHPMVLDVTYRGGARSATATATAGASSTRAPSTAAPTGRPPLGASSSSSSSSTGGGSLGDGVMKWLHASGLQSHAELFAVAGVASVDELLSSARVAPLLSQLPPAAQERFLRAQARQQQQQQRRGAEGGLGAGAQGNSGSSRPAPPPGRSGRMVTRGGGGGGGGGGGDDDDHAAAAAAADDAAEPQPWQQQHGAAARQPTPNEERLERTISPLWGTGAGGGGADAAAAAFRPQTPQHLTRHKHPSLSSPQPSVRWSPAVKRQQTSSVTLTPHEKQAAAVPVGAVNWALQPVGAGAGGDGSRKSLVALSIVQLMRLAPRVEQQQQQAAAAAAAASDHTSSLAGWNDGSSAAEELRLLLGTQPRVSRRSRCRFICRTALSFPASAAFDIVKFRSARCCGVVLTKHGLALTIMGAVVGLPPVLVWGLIRHLPGSSDDTGGGGGSNVTEVVVELLLFGLVLAYLSPVLWSLWNSLRTYASLDRVTPEAMIFRPTLRTRLTFENISAVFGFIFEFLAHCNAAMSADYLGYIQPMQWSQWSSEFHNATLRVQANADPYLAGGSNAGAGTGGMSVVRAYVETPRAWNWADVRNLGEFGQERDLSLPEQLLRTYTRSFSLLFWLAVGCVLLNQFILVLRLTLPGRLGYFLTRETLWAELLWAHLVYWFSGPLFLTILTLLLQALECHYPEANGIDAQASSPRLRANPSIVCWDDGYHSVLATAAFLCIGLLLPAATLLPATSYLETMRDELDFLFSPVYLQLQQVLKALLIFVRVVAGQYDWIKVPAVLFIHLLLLLLNYRMQPCCVQAVNHWRSASFLGVIWLGIIVTTHLIFRPSSGYNPTSDDVFEGFDLNVRRRLAATDDDELRPVLLTLLALGWLLVFTATVLMQLSGRSSALQVSARSMVAFEYASNARKVPPRALEPLIALTMTKEPGAAEAVFLKSTLVEQILSQLRRVARIPNDAIGASAGQSYRAARRQHKLSRRLSRQLSRSRPTPHSSPSLKATTMAGSHSDSTSGADTAARSRAAQINADTAMAIEMASSVGSPENVRAQFGTVWAIANLAGKTTTARDPNTNKEIRPFLERIVAAATQLVKRHGCANDIPESFPSTSWVDGSTRLSPEQRQRENARRYLLEPLLWLLDGRGQGWSVPVQLETMACLVNLSADHDFANTLLTVRYEWRVSSSAAAGSPSGGAAAPENVVRSTPVLLLLQRGLASDIAQVASFTALCVANLAALPAPHGEHVRRALHSDVQAPRALTLLARTFDVRGQQAALHGLCNCLLSEDLAVALFADPQLGCAPPLRTVCALACTGAEETLAPLAVSMLANLCCHRAVVHAWLTEAAGLQQQQQQQQRPASPEAMLLLVRTLHALMRSGRQRTRSRAQIAWDFLVADSKAFDGGPGWDKSMLAALVGRKGAHRSQHTAMSLVGIGGRKGLGWCMLHHARHDETYEEEEMCRKEEEMLGQLRQRRPVAVRAIAEFNSWGSKLDPWSAEAQAAVASAEAERCCCPLPPPRSR
eukprot:COSAG01_NODE_3424_length_6112_cov_1.952769_1_plen_1553_part_00